MLFIVGLNSLSAASSYQEWFRLKAGLLNEAKHLFSAMLKDPWLIIKTGIYSEEGNTVLKRVQVPFNKWYGFEIFTQCSAVF